MLVRLLLGLLALSLATALSRLLWLRLTPAGRRWLLGSLFGVLFLGLLGATVAGRVPWLITAGAALLPILRRLPWLLRLIRGAQSLRQGFRRGVPLGLVPLFDPADGRFDAELKEGPFAGQRLSALDRDALAQCVEGFRKDPLAQHLLQLYLIQRFGPTWAQQPPFKQTEVPSGSAPPLSRRDAAALLGVGEDADPATVRQAHRRLMQRVHPDHGGSDALAALLNAAKDRLLTP